MIECGRRHCPPPGRYRGRDRYEPALAGRLCGYRPLAPRNYLFLAVFLFLAPVFLAALRAVDFFAPLFRLVVAIDQLL